MVGIAEPRRLLWRGPAKADFLAFPASVQREMGYALYLAQMGARHSVMAKTLKDFGGGSVVEIRESVGGNAYRAVYVTRYRDAIYVLHAFQKKSRRGIATPKADIELIKRRLRDLVKEKENQ